MALSIMNTWLNFRRNTMQETKASPHKRKKQKLRHHRCRKSYTPPIIRSDGRTESDRRPWGSAGQNQVRQSEHHIQFGCLFDKPSVSRSSVTQLPFHNRKYMLDFCSDGGFLVLSALGLCFWGVHLFEKFPLMRFYFFSFVMYKRQVQLFVHTYSIPLFSLFCNSVRRQSKYRLWRGWMPHSGAIIPDTHRYPMCISTYTSAPCIYGIM